ncbi:hypothetical protein [Streptomyces sp. NPDC055085]
MTNWPEEIATAETANLPDQLKVFANNESALKIWALAQPDCTHHASGDGIEIPDDERASMEARAAMSDAGYTNNVSWQDFIGLYHLASANENACQDREEAGKYAAGLDCLVKRAILGYGAENNRMKALEQLLIDEPSRQTEAPPEATTQATTGPSQAAAPAAQQATTAKVIVCRPHELEEKAALTGWGDNVKQFKNTHWARWDPTEGSLKFMETASKTPPDANVKGWTTDYPSLEAPPYSMGAAYPGWEFQQTDKGLRYRWNGGEWQDEHPEGKKLVGMDPKLVADYLIHGLQQ